MSDYEDDDIVDAGYYVVTYGGTPKPQGPFPTVREMAQAVGLTDYPYKGYIIWCDENGGISNIPSLNPDDLLTP